MTLNRFFSLHYLLFFIIVGASILHPAAYRYGYNNPLSRNYYVDETVFIPISMEKIRDEPPYRKQR